MLQTPMDIRAWKKYRVVKDAYKNGNTSKADLNLERMNLLDKDNNGSEARAFTSFWILLSLKKDYPEKVTDEELMERLDKCKKEGSYIRKRYERFASRPDTYKGHVLTWKHFMPYDEAYNFYDCETYRAVLPWRLTDEEKEEFKDMYFIPYEPDPSGRDCSCSWQQTARLYRCKDRTIVFLRRTCDC